MEPPRFACRQRLDALIDALQLELDGLCRRQDRPQRLTAFSCRSRQILATASPEDLDHVFDRIEGIVRRHPAFSASEASRA